MTNDRTRGVNWDHDDIERKGDDYQIFSDEDESEDVGGGEDDQEDQSDQEGG